MLHRRRGHAEPHRGRAHEKLLEKEERREEGGIFPPLEVRRTARREELPPPGQQTMSERRLRFFILEASWPRLRSPCRFRLKLE